MRWEEEHTVSVLQISYICIYTYVGIFPKYVETFSSSSILRMSKAVIAVGTQIFDREVPTNYDVRLMK